MNSKNTPSRHQRSENDMSLLKPSWSTPRPLEKRLSTDEADRFAVSGFNIASDEVVVVDERSAMSPSQAVENRLVDLLRDATLPMSHLQMGGLMRRGLARS